MDLDFKDLLAKNQIDPQTVLILRHVPPPRRRKVYPRLAETESAAFNAYQQTQDKVVEDRTKNARYVGSFIGHSAGSAVFIGLYERHGEKERTASDINSDPAIQPLLSYGLPAETRTRLWFDLRPVENFYPEWKGKLIIKWPPPEVAWHGIANQFPFKITAIHTEAVFSQKPPSSYRDWDLEWEELNLLPESWKARLSAWRGIYFLFDTSDGKGYVGKASGAENLLGRWQNYAANGDGGNVKLRGRDPRNFRFSILELVPSDMEDDDAHQREQNWMVRLRTRTRTHGLNLPETDY